MSLPTAIQSALEAVFGARPTCVTPLSGGMIHAAAKVELPNETVFVKWNASALPGMFETEAHGLRALAATQTLRTPQVLLATTDGLILEYIAPRPPQSPDRFARNFGEGLANLHRNALAPDNRFGFDCDNYIGSLSQANPPTATWAEFYRDQRLLPQREIARRNRRLPAHRERLISEVCERLDALLEGLDSRPALLHGDLWSGNFLADGDQPILIDPAAYYGEREMELAYMELFGGFPAELFVAYRAAYPLSEGYLRRRPLHQLYPLLVHLNHFGEPYGAEADNVCRVLLGNSVQA